MRAIDATRAHRQVAQAIKTGRLARPVACEKCGAPDARMKDGRTSIQAHHHRGYDHPLDVEWLCVLCHRKETPAPFGTRAPASKVDWPRVDSIRERHQAGESYYAIAAQEGLNPTTVHRIVTYRSWPAHAHPGNQEALYGKR